MPMEIYRLAAHRCKLDGSICINTMGKKNCILNRLCYRQADCVTTLNETRLSYSNLFFKFLGDHKCLCDAGYTGDGEVVCTDIDECALGYHNCAPVGGICKNTPGHHECDGCLDGYTGNGVFCDDVDECVTGEIGEIFCTQVSPSNAVLFVSINLSRRSITRPL